MKILPRRPLLIFALLFAIAAIAIQVFVPRASRDEDLPDWQHELARQLGIDSASTTALQIEFPPQGTRSLGVILTSDTHSLVHVGEPQTRIMRRVGWGTARIALSRFRDANGRVAIPHLRTAAQGEEDYDVEVELDSAAIVEISRQDLRSYASELELYTLPEADSAVLIERVLEARVRVIVSRRNHASRDVWVRDSAHLAKELNRPGGGLVIERSSRDSLRFQTPERVIVAFATIPLCKVANCDKSDLHTTLRPKTEPSGVEHRTGRVRPTIASGSRAEAHRDSVRIFIDPPHAVLRIDGDVRGAGSRTVVLPRGMHVFEAYAPGYVPAAEKTEITNGMTVVLELTRP